MRPRARRVDRAPGGPRGSEPYALKTPASGEGAGSTEAPGAMPAPQGQRGHSSAPERSIYLSIYLSIDLSTDSPGRRAFIRPSCMREANLGRGWPGLPMYLVLLRRRPRGRSAALGPSGPPTAYMHDCEHEGASGRRWAGVPLAGVPLAGVPLAGPLIPPAGWEGLVSLSRLLLGRTASTVRSMSMLARGQMNCCTINFSTTSPPSPDTCNHIYPSRCHLTHPRCTPMCLLGALSRHLRDVRGVRGCTECKGV